MLSYRKRFQALTSHEQVQKRKLQQAITVLLVKIKSMEETDSRIDELRGTFQRLTGAYFLVAYRAGANVATIENRNRTIASFSDPEIVTNFSFRREQLIELMELLDIPDKTTYKRNAFCGEEVFLRGLYEVCTGENQERMAMNVFGGDQPRQSCAFSWFIDHMFDNFEHLVKNNLEWWHRNGFTKASADAIGSRMEVAMGVNLVAWFIDCNCLPTSVVGGGPADVGANSRRWDERIQQAFYNGWKSVHGLKHQTVDNAFGLTVDMYGPESLRRNDLSLLRESDINNRLAQLQVDEEVQYIIMGDSAYKKRSHITSYHSQEDNIPGHVMWNRKMKKVRISIEWNYGCTASLYRYVGMKHKLQVLGPSRCTKVYVVATLLRNFRHGYYGCETSHYFDVSLQRDFVSHYIKQTDF